MQSPGPFRHLIRTIRADTRSLFERSQRDTSERVAQFWGRAASWADQVGNAAGEVSQDAAKKAGERTAGAAGRAAHRLSELALRLGDRLTGHQDRKP